MSSQILKEIYLLPRFAKKPEAANAVAERVERAFILPWIGIARTRAVKKRRGGPSRDA